MVTGENFTDSAKIDDLRQRLAYPEEESPLFEEAAQCILGGAYRAAVVFAWLAAAEGLKARFQRTAQKDPEIAKLVAEFKEAEAQSRTIDTLLVDKAAKHGMLIHHEQARLHQLRKERNHCGHPSGAQLNSTQAMAALDTAVDLVLSRTERLPRSYAADLIKKASADPTFFPRDAVALRSHVSHRFILFTDEAKSYLAKRVIDAATQIAMDPDRRNFVANITTLGAAVFSSQPDMLAEVKIADLLSARSLGAALICLEPTLFAGLDDELRNHALASVLERPSGAVSWHAPLLGLAAVGSVLNTDLIPAPRFSSVDEQYSALLHVLPWVEVEGYDILLADSMRVELSARREPKRQNEAALKLIAKGHVWCKQLGDVVQVRLGAALSLAIQDEAIKALALKNQIERDPQVWPRHFRRALGYTEPALPTSL